MDFFPKECLRRGFLTLLLEAGAMVPSWLQSQLARRLRVLLVVPGFWDPTLADHRRPELCTPALDHWLIDEAAENDLRGVCVRQ